MARLTADDIVDLSRWSHIAFRDRETAERAMDRYNRYRARQRQQPGRGAGEPPGERRDRAA